jgi:hypothetical protein
VLKGPAIMAAVYGDVGLRPMADLDVLCRQRDVLAVRNLLASMGFSKAGAPYLYAVEFHRDDPDMLLELHFDVHHLVGHKRQFLEGAWRDRVTVSLEEWRFPVLSREHAIVFELGHCAWHGFDLALKHLVDFAGRLLPRSGEVNTDRLTVLLTETGLAEAYALFTAALGRMFGVALGPAPVAPPDPERLDVFERRLIGHSRAMGFEPRRAAGAGLRQQHGFVSKVVFAWRRLVPPLPALQAAYGLRTPMHAVGWIPVHVGRTLTELAVRARKGS